MSWNGGCSCGCNGNWITVLCKMQQGDTFTVYSTPRNDEEIQLLAEGWDYIMCFRDYLGNILLKASLKGGRITTEDDMYVMTVEHSESVNWLGNVYIETTVTANDEADVYHGDRILTMQFEPRKNNEVVPGGDTPAPEPTPIPDSEIATDSDIDNIMEVEYDEADRLERT